jgi:hypothetical protein
MLAASYSGVRERQWWRRLIRFSFVGWAKERSDVPTIYLRSSRNMVGTLRFAHPTAAACCKLICLPRKRRFRAGPATNQPARKSLLIFRNRVKPSAQKYSAFASTQISRITPRVSPDERGARERHERAVGCGGRGWRTRRRRRMRTVKSCGSGAAVLALSGREVSRRRRRQKSRSPGRARSKP